MSLYYKVVGEGYPIVFIHGWGLDHQAMLHTMEPIFEKRAGWKRIYIDLPGMGKSEADPAMQNSDDFLKEVLSLLDALIPNQPFIVSGYSYGGYMARGIASARNKDVRGLLLIAPMVIPAFDKRVLPKKVVLKKDDKLIASLSAEEAEAFSSMAIVEGQKEWERFKADIFIPSKQTNEAFVNDIQKNGYGFSFDISATLEYPALIITGRQDHVVGYHDAWNLIEDYPRATLAVLDMGGHNLQIEQIDVFNSLVHNWLDRLELVIQ